MENKHKKVIAHPINFSFWERSEDRTKTLYLLDVYLNDKLNLITIQLGENSISDLTKYKSDFEQLVKYTAKKAPNANILIIGDWWDFKRNEIRKETAKNNNCTFVDLSSVIGDKKYQSKAGQICHLSNGQTITVTKEAASHPSDLGMHFIADEIIKHLEKTTR
ncbi:MAG: SGNH/GDSL hydrolase family protein [Candidatus Gastranaerophilales bacterium]|nr:SGNH/GDSL hydrolase family protein [Candidatus Gastranaerophilales bacterium]